MLLAFSFVPKLQNFPKCLHKPIPLIFTCTGIQVVICPLWVIFAAPAVEENVSLPFWPSFASYLPPKAGNYLGITMKPNSQTFGMLICFIAWIMFIPIYATPFGKYLPAVEIIVTLISNCGILCCIFFPKCYVILCKQETNTKSAFLKMIFSYSPQCKQPSRVTLHWTPVTAMSQQPISALEASLC